MEHFRKTKIVASLGPTTDSVEILKDLIQAGLNVARLNFSHGTHEDHKKRIDMVRQASSELGIPIALLLDTKGPEIRTAVIPGGGTLKLETGKTIIVTTEPDFATTEKLSLSYQSLHEEISVGKHILIADGLVNLEVMEIKGREMHCIIRNGSEIGSRKNVNVPGVKTKLPAITEKDKQDILFGIENDMDFIAASFIRRPSDVEEIRSILDEHGSKIRIIPKIEDEEGLGNIEEIIQVADGIMVARGDLGVQLPPEQIPLAQKRIISLCNQNNKPVITATQMLDSMINNPQPTRAEVTDVANAIFDGTDAVMLSGETASGKYPVKSVETLNKIALSIEGSQEYSEKMRAYIMNHVSGHDVSTEVCRSVSLLADNTNAAAIVAPTLSGNTPRIISRFRPPQGIIGITATPQVQRQLLLHWGIYPIIRKQVETSDEMIQEAIQAAIDHDFIKMNDKVVIAAGIPLNSPMMLNMIKVHFLGNILQKGKSGLGTRTTGRIAKVPSAEYALTHLKLDGSEILLAKHVDESYLPILKNIKGIIQENPISIDEAYLKVANPELVIVAEAEDAAHKMENQLIVSIDGNDCVVYEGVITESK